MAMFLRFFGLGAKPAASRRQTYDLVLSGSRIKPGGSAPGGLRMRRCLPLGRIGALEGVERTTAAIILSTRIDQ